MPEIYNPNPTIYTSSKSSSRKSERVNGEYHWIDEQDEQDETDVEPIDQDEIFGALQLN
jgi:hypothetical protein